MKRAVRRRRRMAGWAVAVAAGLICLLLASPWSERMVMPGELSPPHATLTDRCDLCHQQGSGAVARAIGSLGGDHLVAGPVSNNQCIACHDRGRFPLAAHSVDTGNLSVHNLRDEGSFIVELAHGYTDHESLSCITCHREHRGEESDITTFSDAQCQACHVQRFASFSKGHPPFERYPFDTPQRIAFDHERHLNVHFADEEFRDRAPTDCRGCHTQSGDGRDMTIGSYENTCAACHADDISGAGRAGDRGIPVFSLPAVDLRALRDAGGTVGHWPVDARVIETPISPFLRLLLRADPRGESQLHVLGRTNLLDLSDATEEQRDAALWLLWTTRSILDDIRSRGHVAITDRIETTLRRPLDPDTSGALLAGLPGDVLVEAIGRWLPDLEAELEAYRNGEPLPTVNRSHAGAADTAPDASGDGLAGDLLGDDLLGGDMEDPFADQPEREAGDAIRTPGEDWVAYGGWHLMDSSWGIHYRPVGHADPFLRAWTDVAASSGRGTILDLIAEPDAPGACVKCHARTSTGVAWRSQRALGSTRLSRPWTHFSHAPHLSLTDADDGCRTCHVPKAFNTRVDGHTRFNSFLDINADQCNTCHQPERAGNSCLQCHNYHVR